MGRAERLRWRIAFFVNRRLPGQCWADLVSFALDGGLPWRPQREGCRSGVAEVGACYCGKLRRGEDA